MSLSVGKIVLSFGLAFLLATGGLLSGAGRSPHAARAAELPDLVVTALTAPDTVVAQPQIEVSWTVANQGTADAKQLDWPYGSWGEVLYLSADNILDQQDTELRYSTSANPRYNLAAGSSDTRTATVPISRAASGSYYLLVMTDAYGIVNESNEANNVLARPITIKVLDLVPTALTAPDTASTQQAIEVSWTVANQGTGDILGQWYDYFYLSTDNILDQQDTRLTWATQYFGQNSALAPGNSYTKTKKVTESEAVRIPHISAGSYYLLLKADGQYDPWLYGSVYEANEDNNVLARPITIKVPDLVVTALTAPDTVVIRPDSTSIEVSWTVTNQGTGDTWETLYDGILWIDALYLSTDNAWDEQDTNLRLPYQGWSHTSGLAAGDSYTETKIVRIPQTALGAYYLLLQTDMYEPRWAYKNLLYESNEANNVLARPITVTKPDLVLTALTAPDTVVTQQTIEILWTVANQGTGDAVVDATLIWWDSVYFSTDNIFDEQDTFLADVVRSSSLAPGSSYTVTKTVSIPVVPAGSYYLLVVTNGGAYLPEIDADNNVLARAITVKTPDLVPVTLVAPDKAPRWQVFDVSWTVSIEGTSDALPAAQEGMFWIDNLYLSTDEVWDGQDRFLGSNISSFSSITVGSSYTLTAMVKIPTVPAGSYYLLLKVDAENLLYETNEQNNLLAVKFTVKEPDADLKVTALAAPDTAAAGQQIELSWTVANQGTGEALALIPWRDVVYFSTDTIVDEYDAGLTYAIHSSNLAAGGSYTETATVAIPEVDAGAYYLLARTDTAGWVSETKETNNVLVRPITITAPDVDLVPTVLTAPDTAVAGQQIEVSWTVANQGTADAMPPWSDKVYFSADNAWDGQDIYLGSATHTSGLSAGSSYTKTITVPVPTVPAGSYYLLVRTDTGKSVPESNGDNNDRVRAITVPVVYNTLTISVAGNGSTTPAVGTHTYQSGTVVNVSATPTTGWQFVNWTGEVANPDSATTTVTMNGDKTVTANFSEITHTLTINVSDNGSTAPAAGSYTHPYGTVVSIAATPDAGWQFDSWTGDVAAPNAAATTVTIDADKTVTANFSLITYTLTLVIRGNGSTTPTAGTYTYPAGTVVSLTVAPAAGWQFANWTGNVANPYAAGTIVTMDADKTVTANFIKVTIRGDANGDGAMDSLDVTAIERIIALLNPPTTGADANGDGRLDATDITKIERMVAGLD